MSSKLKKIGSFFLLFLLLLGAIFYSSFVSEQIYEESRSHLLEIYKKSNNTFSVFASRNWSILNDWGSYTDKSPDKEDEEVIRQFISNSQKNWGFTDFYFLNNDGSYVTADGKTGEITGSLGSYRTFDEDNRRLFTANISSGERQMFFAASAVNGIYMGFVYTAVAISYNNHDVGKMIDISSFYGDSESYIVYSDGDIMFSTDYDKDTTNIISYIEKNRVIEESEIEQIKQSVSGNVSGMLQCTMDKKEYYIVYQPLTFEDGMMIVGIVPKNIVNKNMRQVQSSTVVVMAGVFVVTLLYVFFFLRQSNKKELQNKNIELEHREKVLDMLIKPTDDIYIIFTRQYEVKYVSPNTMRIIGIDKELIRDNIHELMVSVSDNKVTLNDEMLDSIAKGESWETSRYLINQATKEKKWYQETIYHMPDEYGAGYILVLSDRTKERMAAERLQSALDSAKSANESKSMFLANISHDIRTPMNAIMGCADLLAKQAEDADKVREYAKKITSSGQLLLGLINDVLDMSKIESGKTSLNIAPFNLADLLEEISTVVSAQAKAKHQEFEIYASGIQRELLLGDRVRLGQILMNLLSNAVKYTHVGGKIKLNITALKQENSRYQKLRFEVYDNGIGMTPEFLKVIFEPFMRVENSATQKIQGTGLGMTITKNIVDIMGGNISVKSDLGKGSTFIVELDFQIQKEDDERAFWKEHNIYRILLVDDEADICENIKNIMRDTGVDVSYATDGETAVGMFEQADSSGSPYNLVLLDLKMPHMDGIETARRIRDKAGRELPILILTSFDWSDVEKEAVQAGIDGFMPKPFFISVLKSRIESIVRSRKKSDMEEFQNLSISGMHFLVVEDYELNYEILKERLEIEGATCDIAVNGKHGVDMFEASEPGRFDAVLMDVQMPVMDGYEAARSIRSGNHPLAKTIPIIAMTANAFDEDIKKSLNAGMDAHIAKPIDINLLKKVVIELKSRQNSVK